MPQRRSNLTITVSPSARDHLERLSKTRCLSLSQAVESLIEEGWDTDEHYMLKQTALQSFLCTALIMAMAGKTFPPQELEVIQREASQVATRLYGAPPQKRFNCPDDDYGEAAAVDPRIEALFKAFASE